MQISLTILVDNRKNNITNTLVILVCDIPSTINLTTNGTSYIYFLYVNELVSVHVESCLHNKVHPKSMNQFV